MIDPDEPMVWRGPIVTQALQQLLEQTNWHELDYLIVDMPPGTGDVALSLSQTVPAAGSIVVTTPQQVSLADTRRAVRMYQKLNIPTLGLVENMSFYECTNCHHVADIFGHGGGEQTAEQLGIPFLGRLPLYQPIRVGSDRGIPLVIAEPDSVGTRAFMDLAEATISQLAVSAHKAIVANKGKIPLIQVK
jgi:ATP-binding protein involved in chromosome partitioning